MEIDFGGTAKEYAVSLAANFFYQQLPKTSVLVNLGGYIQVTCPRSDNKPWDIGVENTQGKLGSNGILSIKSSALATSGDAKRYLV